MSHSLYPVEPRADGSKYLIVGTGQLACAFQELLGEQCMLVGHGFARPLPGTIDANPYRVMLEEKDDIARLLACAEPFVHTVVNCAGLVHRETCESEFERAYAVNAFAPGTMARWCGEHGKRFVQVSDAEVFPGRLPFGARYLEGDPNGPLSLYGLTKKLGEHLAFRFNKKALIVRTSQLFSATGSHGYYSFSPDRKVGWNNLLEVIYKGEQGEEQGWPDDIWSVPTDARAVAWAITRLVERGKVGLRHVMSGGIPVTPFEFAQRVAGLVKEDHGRILSRIFPILNRNPLVPKNVSLGTKFPRELLGLPSWETALRDTIATFYR